MDFVIWAILGVALFFFLFFLIRAWLFGRHVVQNFQRGNVVVDGHKGRGKDLVFQYVINKRKKDYYANISYGGEYHPITLKAISIEPNTYDNFISDKVAEVERKFVEKRDFYVSDGGIYLPSYADSLLHKTYKSMPLFYPMSRHLCDSNVHVNIQNVARLWKPLREQADFFVHVRGSVKLPHFILVHAITYDKYESAEKCLSPLKSRMLNGYSKAETDLFRAEHGEIKSGWLIIRKKTIKYDTRAFEKVIYGHQPRLTTDPTPAEGIKKDEERENDGPNVN